MSIISTGFKLPTSIVANASGVAAWTDPSNILLVDDQFAVSGGPTNILTVGNFNHNIPQGSTILNITLRVKGYRGSFNTTLNLYAVDDTTGVEYSYPYNPPFQGFSGTNTLWTLNPTLFATTWDVNQANNIKLKLIADGELHLDSAEIEITYDDGNSSIPQALNYTNLVGIFQVGETVTGGTSGATGIVVTDNGVDEMTLTSVVGSFQLGETITGGTSFATATVDSPSGQVVCDEFIQAQPFQLSRAMTSSDTVLFLTSFSYPGPNGGGDPILLADAHGDLIVTVDQGKPTEENILVIGVDHNYQGTGLVRLNFGNITNRGLDFKYPYTHDITKVYNHSGTAEVVISNSAPFYDRFLKKCQIGALVSAPITVEDEGVVLTARVEGMNFTGNGVQVTVPDPVGAPDDVEINIPGGGTAPPVVVSTSSATSGNVQVPTLTWSHTSSGINRLLVVQVSTEESSAVTGITYNGVPLSLEIADTDVGNNIRTEQWSLVAPPVGTYSIVVSLAPAAYISAGAESYVSVDQASPIGNTTSGTGNSNTPSIVNITTNNNSLVADSLATALTPIAYSVGPGQALSWSHTANTDTRQGASSTESAGTAPDNVTMSYVLTQVTDWVMTSVEINGLPGVGGVQSVTGTYIDNTDPANPVSVVPLNNTAAVVPTVNDDETLGYAIDSKWFDSVTGILYTCEDATTGAAVWTAINAVVAGVNSVTGNYVDNTDPANPIITVPLNNPTAVVAPTVNDDSGAGYSIGSEWFNTATSTLYIAQDVTVGAAVWDAVTGGGSGNTDYTVNADETISTYNTATWTPIDLEAETSGTVAPTIYFDGFLDNTNGNNLFQKGIAAPSTLGNEISFGASQIIRLKQRAATDGGATVQLSIGLLNTAVVANIADRTDVSAGAKFVFDGPAGAIYACVADGAANTNVDITGAIVVSDVNLYEIVVNGTTDVEFWVNGALATTINTNVPAAGIARVTFGGFTTNDQYFLGVPTVSYSL